jgi:SAM-dependent methyltransferase
VHEEIARLGRERQEADRRYNEALTELDQTVIALSGRDLTRSDFDRLATALIVYLQQITGFVESKDRQIAAEAAERADRLGSALESLAELRTQMAVLRRTVQHLTREAGRPLPRDARAAVDQPTGIGHRPSTISHQPSALSHDDVTYVAFEDQFRGSDEAVRERLGEYVPLFAGASNVLDLGCGRGEFLLLLADAGVRARGVDANAEMAAIARDRGLDVAHADALAFLMSADDESVGGIMASQVVEHLEPSYLMRLLSVAREKLKPGAPIVLETINPACWLAFFSSYIRDLTHVRPIHPDTLQYLLRANGFERVGIRFRAPVPEHVKLKTAAVGAELERSSEQTAQALAALAHTANANAALLNDLLFSYLDYAVVGYRA